MRKSNRFFIGIVAFMVLATLFKQVYAADSGFIIKKAQTKLVNKVYVLQAAIEYDFSNAVLQAIESGVPMVVVLDIRLNKPRRFWWNKQIARLKQRFRLHYHALAEQYIVKNINSGAQHTAPTLHSALYDLRDIKNLPLIDQQLLDANLTYSVQLKVSIEFDSLPVPLKLSAYTSRKWWLGSPWYELELK